MIKRDQFVESIRFSRLHEQRRSRGNLGTFHLIFPNPKSGEYRIFFYRIFQLEYIPFGS